jgi:hypothetical protein
MEMAALEAAVVLVQVIIQVQVLVKQAQPIQAEALVAQLVMIAQVHQVILLVVQAVQELLY